MANKRYAKFPSKGAQTGQSGPRKDSVEPVKTKKWPGVPGRTNPTRRNYGMKEMKQGLDPEGV
ncbi:MAG: hypothetical protein ACYSWU_20935 [Planctomycetota bacterium]|jgi:hypothetical protein